MRIFRLFVFVLSIVVGLTAYQPKVRAAEYYDNAQMNYIFSGAKFKIDGLDPYRKSGELPSHLACHTFILHRADVAQI